MIKMICEVCGSDNVLKDAFAAWDMEKQAWVLHAVYDDTVCDDCGAKDCVEEQRVQ